MINTSSNNYNQTNIFNNENTKSNPLAASLIENAATTVLANPKIQIKVIKREEQEPNVNAFPLAKQDSDFDAFINSIFNPKKSSAAVEIQSNIKKKDYHYDDHSSLLDIATQYLVKAKNKFLDFLEITDKMSEKEMINEMLKKRENSAFQGFCVGEVHNDPAPKEFLVDNMQHLAQEGVKVIFMEQFRSHLQADLDAYMQGAPMSQKLREEFSVADKYFGFSPKYSYGGILEAARNAGIRIVAINTNAAMPKDSRSITPRIISMNYFAYKIMKKTIAEMGNCKFVALMGVGHLSKRANWILGIGSLLGCPYMQVAKKASAKSDQPSISYNQSNFTGDNADICADVVYHRPPPKRNNLDLLGLPF